jgi:hypothetical protein
LLTLVVAACGRGERTLGTPDATPAESAAQSRPERTSRPRLGIANLGVAVFGDTPERAVEELTSALGDPDEDTGWIESFSEFGTCPGERIRVVRWQQLRAYFTDGKTDYGEKGTRHLFMWDYGPRVATGRLDLETDEGITAGSTVAEVKEAYGEDALVDDEMFGPRFQVSGPTEAGVLTGSLTSVSDDGRVEYLAYGAPLCGE